MRGSLRQHLATIAQLLLAVFIENVVQLPREGAATNDEADEHEQSDLTKQRFGCSDEAVHEHGDEDHGSEESAGSVRSCELHSKAPSSLSSGLRCSSRSFTILTFIVIASVDSIQC